MTEKRYTMEFDGRIVAAAMDLQTALILAEAFAEKYYDDMDRGAKIDIYATAILFPDVEMKGD